MHIYFNPDYSVNPFVNFKDTNILFDVEFLNTNALIVFLEKLLGIQSLKISRQERVSYYYRELKKYLSNHKDNSLYKSFQKDSLGTALQCLNWRDTLLNLLE